ncbi:response regulator [Arenibacter sp. M-2]|uniref:response regulator n=1 Tax=unclassified Arenibacter TaxID=2615047 RepID=UPI000D763949|nr:MULTISPECIES: response regulator [unclassified Arenibacter]MDL5512388.1 response regulator [Arenibacter sp. M-2]PXX26394.1 CRP-like cAMP-binding protein [Arenibacter sp. ARW7G5Y1]|tara:strand:+ start:6536 stop:7603 length:1068 start_codon:yes stop_codon:yes gene_type:complete
MKRILLIEDNKDVRENTADILELANYEVTTAENGKIGVERAEIFRPDVIICDIMMPELDGYGVLELLGKNNATSSIPFIFLTAKTDRAEVRLGMNLGADDYLTKPFEEKELLEAIASRLRKSDFLKKEIAKNMEGLNNFLDEATQYMDMKSLSKDYPLKKYHKKEIIFWEGDNAHSLYFIEYGSVKTYKSTESGKEFVTGILGPGDFIGQLSLLNSNKVYVENATVLEDAELCAIPRKDFTKLLYGNSVVSQKFIGMISNNIMHLQEQLVDMAYASVRKRAAKALLDLYDKQVILDKPNGGIGIPREDFAGLIGTATETAIRTLSDFKEEGLIATDHGRRITITNEKGLREVADF